MARCQDGSLSKNGLAVQVAEGSIIASWYLSALQFHLTVLACYMQTHQRQMPKPLALCAQVNMEPELLIADLHEYTW